MFILEDEKKSRWFPVEVELFDDNGRKRTFTFDGELECADQVEVNEFLERAKDAASGSRRETESDVELARRRLLAWKKIQRPDGAELPFTEDNKERLIRQPGVARGITRAWLRAHGIELKN